MKKNKTVDELDLNFYTFEKFGGQQVNNSDLFKILRYDLFKYKLLQTKNEN